MPRLPSVGGAKHGDGEGAGTTKCQRAEEDLNKSQRHNVNQSVKHLDDPVIMTPMQTCPSKTKSMHAINQSVNQLIDPPMYPCTQTKMKACKQASKQASNEPIDYSIKSIYIHMHI